MFWQKYSPVTRWLSRQSFSEEYLPRMSPKPARIMSIGACRSTSVSARTAQGGAAETVTFIPFKIIAAPDEA